MLCWQVANQAQEGGAPHQEAEQEAAWSLPHPEAGQQAAQEAAWSASPHQAVEQEAAESAPPHSVAPAVVSWDSFKSLAKPGDRLRLIGDSTVPSGDANTGQTTSFGVVTPAGSGLPLATSADVAEWVTDVSSAARQTGDDAELAGTGNYHAWHDLRIGDPAVGDGQMQWGHRLEAARSQAEKLLVLAEVTHPVIMQENATSRVHCRLRQVLFLKTAYLKLLLPVRPHDICLGYCLAPSALTSKLLSSKSLLPCWSLY